MCLLFKETYLNYNRLRNKVPICVLHDNACRESALTFMDVHELINVLIYLLR